MGDKLINVFGTIVILAIVTTLVLPGRQTPAVIDAGGRTFIGSIKAAMGNG
jgi:hypothetical protein